MSINQYIRDYFHLLGYTFSTANTFHFPSSLEKLFIKAVESLRKESVDYRHLYYLQEIVLHPIGEVDFNKVSPYDFLVVHGLNIALVEIDGPQHFHHVGGNIKELSRLQKHRRLYIDRAKTEFCLDMGISLLRVAYLDGKEMKEILKVFLRKMVCAQEPVIMYSSSLYYQHLIPDENYPRSENIYVYDECKHDDDMDVCQPYLINYYVSKPCHEQLLISLPQPRKWLREVPVSQEDN